MDRRRLIPPSFFKGILAVTVLTLPVLPKFTLRAEESPQSWEFEFKSDVAPPPWGSKLGPGFVQDAEEIRFENGIFGYRQTSPHAYFWLNFERGKHSLILDAEKSRILTFRFYASAPGRISLFYYNNERQPVSSDQTIDVIDGWNEYQVDLSRFTFGRDVKPADERNYRRWGGEEGAIHGIRIDTWFPVGTEIKFDYVRFSESAP